MFFCLTEYTGRQPLNSILALEESFRVELTRVNTGINLRQVLYREDEMDKEKPIVLGD